MKTITKDGPQLTGAQALDVILAKLDALTAVVPNGFGFIAGKFAGYQYIRDFVEVIREEKFDDDQTENPFSVLSNSRSYEL